MPVKILKAETGEQVLYDSVTMMAFGQVHQNSDRDLNDFLEYLLKDARTYSNTELYNLYYDWLKTEGF